MKTLITCAILILFHTGAWAQPNLDSLWGVWIDTTQPDTSRLNAIFDYAWNGYLYSQPDSAYYFAQLQYDFADSKGLKKQMADALNLQGVSFLNRGDYDQAMDYHTRSLKIREDVGNKMGIANSLNNIGVIFKEKNEYAKAIDYYTRSLGVQEEIRNNQGIANSLINIGLIFKERGKYTSAIEYYTRSLKINEQIGDKQGVAYGLNNIGIIYEELGDYANAVDYYNHCLKISKEIGDKLGVSTSLNNIGIVYRNQGYYDEAIDCHDRSLAISQETGDKLGVSNSLNNIGLVYKNQGEYDHAINYYTRSLKIAEAIGNRQGVAASLNNIGSIYVNQGNYVKALETGKRSIQLSQKTGAVKESQYAAQLIWEVNKKLGNYKQSLEMHELYIQMRDSIASEENIKELARFEFQYEYEKKALADSLQFVADQKQVELEHRVEIAQAETERNIYISAGAALLMLSFLIFQRRHNRNKLLLKEKEADYQREVLYATINSQESERRRIARDLHDEVGAMLSTIKLNLGTVEMQLKQAGLSEQLTSPARNLVDETITNVRGISKNLLPPTLEEFGLAHALNDLSEKVEEASGIPFKKDIQPLSHRMPIEHELALFRIIQEMINNALKHAEATEFTLTMREQNGQLRLSFSDNGKGFDLEAVKKSKSGKTGLGLKNLENRVGVAGGEMEFKAAPGKGTELKVWVPLAYQQERAA